MAFGIPSGVHLGTNYRQWKQWSEGLAAKELQRNLQSSATRGFYQTPYAYQNA